MTMPRSFKSHQPKPARWARDADPAPAPGRTAAPGAAAPSQPEAAPEPAKPAAKATGDAKEIGGPSGPEPTRYGDWERKGICVDF
jgi:hypothetical protein